MRTKTRTKIPLAVICKMSREQFAEVLGGIFENAQWVAREAWESRPFASREELRARMMDAVRRAPAERVTEFLRGHPELASPVPMAELSVAEQQGAGLYRLTEADARKFANRNREYAEKFGFPFILAVKGRDSSDILAAMSRRLRGTAEKERETALAEIGKIASFRLEELVEG